MSRTNKFFYNSISTAFYQVILTLTGFITPRMMLKYYGSEINGLVSSINQFIIYFRLVEAGLSGAAVYALYKPLADNDHKAVNKVVTAAKKFYTQSGYIFLSLTIGLAIFYPLYVKTSVLNFFETSLLVLILGVNGALEFFTLSKYRVLLTADQKIYVVSLASSVHSIVNTIIIVTLSKLKINILLLKFIALISIFLRSFILYIYVNLRYKYLNFREKPDFNALNKRWDALYLQIIGVVNSGAPTIILTILTKNLKLISIYTVYNMIVSGIRGILDIFSSGLSASFGNVIAKGEKSVLQNAYTEFEFSYYSLITVVYSIAFVTIMPFIRVYTSGVADINYDIPLLGFLFILNGLLYNIKTPQSMLVISAGLFKETKWQTTVQSAIVVIVGIILTPYLGIVGVLLASIFANIYRDIDLIYFITKNVTHLPVKNTLIRIIRILICIMVICVPFLFFNQTPVNYLSWISYAFFIGIYALFVVTINGLIFERNIMFNIIKRMLRMVKS